MRIPHAILLGLVLAGCAMNPQQRQNYDNLQRTLLEVGRADQGGSSSSPASSLEPEPKRVQTCTAYPSGTRGITNLHCR